MKLKDYLPSCSLQELQTNSTLRADAIAQLAHALGADFFQYVEKPNDYSVKNAARWSFFPSGSDKAILFLPDNIYDVVGESLEREISSAFDLRIKYISQPFQL